MKNENEIIYQDDNFVVVNKTSGFLVFDDKENKNTLKSIVEKHIGQEVFCVYSLDKEASGVLVFAKNKKTLKLLHELFREGKVLRQYVLLLSGVLENDNGTIDQRILVSKDSVHIDSEGQKALTKYETIEKFCGYTLVKATPLTQVRKQIRLHFWSIGNPLAIDKEYAGSSPIFLSSFKRRYKSKPDIEEKPLISRLTMHCEKIEFEMPAAAKNETKKYVFKSSLPDDLEITIKQLRKYYK
ncbi:MAG: RluA family pseudouridine synthase [Elusimicrobiota bacterium]|jgi:23S rRNA pseudouridine955/2504/2580 synthase/23S rRNA pseudouridine1911/1915/1917 synthase|nr:RluA family pseudouridine synthase [Elusimicrobiota bacterium]